MKRTLTSITVACALVIATSVVFSGCASGGGDAAKLQAQVDSLRAELKKFTDAEALTQMRLVRFDSLDYEFYSNQDWKNFNISHADDIKVIYPDGSTTTGLHPHHIDMLTPTFVFAPDTRIKKHPVRFGSGDWTCVIGEMEGTFTQPMPIGNGKSIAPTNKSFKLGMTTVGHWKDGQLIEEYLFYDNLAFMKQIGAAQ